MKSNPLSSWEAQVRKGILEYLVLEELEIEDGYGYDVLQRIRKRPAMEVTESAVYPILNRLAKEGLLSSVREQSSLGPPRRRYTATSFGRVRLLKMKHFIGELEKGLKSNRL